MQRPLVVHYWADLQSVHGFRCYDNIAPNAKCQRVLVLALCLVCFKFSSLLLFGSVRQIKMATRQLLGARKYDLMYHIASYSRARWK